MNYQPWTIWIWTVFKYSLFLWKVEVAPIVSASNFLPLAVTATVIASVALARSWASSSQPQPLRSFRSHWESCRWDMVGTCANTVEYNLFELLFFIYILWIVLIFFDVSLLSMPPQQYIPTNDSIKPRSTWTEPSSPEGGACNHQDDAPIRTTKSSTRTAKQPPRMNRHGRLMKMQNLRRKIKTNSKWLLIDVNWLHS